MTLQLKNVRLAFPRLFTPEQFQGQGKAKFSATFIMPKDHPAVKEIEAAIQHVAAEKWGAKAAATLNAIRNNPNKFCFKDGSTKGNLDGFAGNMFISASNTSRPTVVDQRRTQLTEADGKPYAGCYVTAAIEIWAQDNGYGKGINATLRGVQFYRDGAAFSGSAPASADEFEDLSAELEDALA